MAKKQERSTATSYEVTIGGQTFIQTKRDGVQRLEIHDHVDMVTMLVIQLGGAEAQPEWNFNIGDPVECKLGKGEEPIFKGEVTAIEPAYEVSGITSITIRAFDHMHRLGRGRRTRFWTARLDSQVVEEVGAECSLSVEADGTSQIRGYILQRNESNVAFLKRLAARNNYILRVEKDALTFKKPTFEGMTKEVKMGESLRSVRFAFNSVDQVQKVVVRGWNPAMKMEVEGSAVPEDLVKIGGGEYGATLSGLFGESVAYVTDIPVNEQAQATELAKAELDRLARQFCRGTAQIQGDDQVRAGSMVEFSGLPEGQNGKYFVIATRHVISVRSGYTTELTFCSNTMGT
jgi:phage protein D